MHSKEIIPTAFESPQPFEPVPANYERLLETIRLDPEVPIEAHQLAFSDMEGSAELHLSTAEGDMAKHGNKSSSLLGPGKLIEVHPWLKFEEWIVVPTRTLDAFCEMHRIPFIDLIHMDVQGAELKVLKGSMCMMEHIRAVWLEVERIALYEDQPLKDEVEAFMRRPGFVLAFSTWAM